MRLPIVPFVAAAGTAIAAWRFRALSTDGALASTAVGGAIVSGAGVLGAASLLTFFVSSTLLGRLPPASGRRQRRGNERDAVQVLANGGVAAVLATAMAARHDRDSRLLLSGFGGALAAASADTWATEIGTRLGARPRSILTGQSIPVGASGGVSPAGILASAAGAASIAAVVAASSRLGNAFDPSPMPAIVLGGVLGSMADSVLGAAVQEVRFCAACGEETEAPRHGCGRPTVVVRGVPGFDNDVVNLAATVVGAATASTITWSTSTRAPCAKR